MLDQELRRYDVNEWLAEQEFCDGNIGMFGASYEGRMQLNTASEAPPHLKAIMPEVAPFDWYTIVHEGGTYSSRFEQTGNHFRNCDLDPTAAPVDDDVDGSLAAEARRGHEEGNDYSATAGKLPDRDSRNADGVPLWQERSGERLLAGIERSGVASYQTSGWFARVGLEQLLWFANMQRSSTAGKHRVLMGPWPQGGIAGADEDARQVWAVETLRFMDYWLKGIDNGIMDEPPVVYATTDSTKNRHVTEWRTTSAWPHPDAVATEFHLGAGASGTVASANDGTLATTPADAGFDEVVIDYDAASPTGDFEIFQEPGPDFTPFDERVLTYTTKPLTRDLELTGHPVVHLFVSADDADCDLIVHLEDVDEAGVSTYVSRMRQRASYRTEAPAPCFNFDAPWHSYARTDALPLPPGQPVQVAFQLLPVSYLFRAGHRIRVNVSAADATIMAPLAGGRPVTVLHPPR